MPRSARIASAHVKSLLLQHRATVRRSRACRSITAIAEIRPAARAATAIAVRVAIQPEQLRLA